MVLSQLLSLHTINWCRNIKVIYFHTRGCIIEMNSRWEGGKWLCGGGVWLFSIWSHSGISLEASHGLHSKTACVSWSLSVVLMPKTSPRLVWQEPYLFTRSDRRVISLHIKDLSFSFTFLLSLILILIYISSKSISNSLQRGELFSRERKFNMYIYWVCANPCRYNIQNRITFWTISNRGGR